VAEYIVEHGGSYHFGNSTCRKRWDELVREMAAGGKSTREWFFEDMEHHDSDHERAEKDREYGRGFGLGR
jgi:hypothetical protein